jgi:hypothetical protein
MNRTTKAQGLYARCPKCSAASAGQEVCPACGLVFVKYLKALAGTPPRAAPVDGHEGESLGARARELFLPVPDEVAPAAVYARSALLAVLVAYGVHLAALDVPAGEIWGTLLHYPAVPIHEFGHVLFLPFGEFLHLLGGSLFQVGLPLAFGGILLVKNRDPFAAAVTLWWSAVEVMDVAPYVYDAKVPQHVLLTGRTGDTGAHDFIDVLGDLGLLERAQGVGYGVHHFGVAMMGAALAWAGYIVWRQLHARKL